METSTPHTGNRPSPEVEQLLDRIRELEALSSDESAPPRPSIETGETPFRALIDRVDRGAAILSPDGTMTYANRAFAELVQRPADRVVRSRISRYLEPTDAKRIGRFCKDPRRAHLESNVTIRCADGTTVPATFSLVRFAADELSDVGLVVLPPATGREISGSEASLARAVLDQIDETLFVCDPYGVVLFASRAAESLCGGSPIGRPLDALLKITVGEAGSEGGGQLALYAFSLSSVAKGHTYHRRDALVRTGNERERQMFLSASPITGPSEEILGLLVKFTDPSRSADGRALELGGEHLEALLGQEKARTEELERSYRELQKAQWAALNLMEDLKLEVAERQRTEEQLRQLSRAVEQSPVSVLITDRDGRIQYANPRFVEASGYALEEVMGKNPSVLKSGHTPQEVYRSLWETILSGHTWHGEFQNKRRNGEIYWEAATVSPLTDSSGNITHFIALNEDITERKNLHEQLLQAQKMESVGRLAGGIAHDFNNLLTAIIGYSTLMLRRVEPDSPFYENTVEIKRAAQQAANLTRQLLAFSRKQILALQTLNINTIIDGVEKLIRRLLGEDIELVTDLEPALRDILADASQMEQVIMNLVVNARDAMPQGGTITIRTRMVADEESRESRTVCLSITDTGGGMDEETIEHIFEPFFTTKEAGHGTGLGLSTVYGIVTQSGGKIEVESRIGSGTSFHLYFPVTVARPDAGEISDLMVEPARGTETILVVEDEQSVRSLSRLILEKAGYHVLVAADGLEALRIAAEIKSSIHLLLTDVVLPRMSSSEIVGQIKTLFPAVRVLYMSGYTDDVLLRHRIKTGQVDFLQKPFEPNALLTRIREILDRS